MKKYCPVLNSNPGPEFKKSDALTLCTKNLHLMAIVVYITGFRLCVFLSSKVVNIILHVPKDAAFILSMPSADQCRCC